MVVEAYLAGSDGGGLPLFCLSVCLSVFLMYSCGVCTIENVQGGEEKNWCIKKLS